MPSLKDIPVEIWLKIFSHLPEISPRILSVTSRRRIASPITVKHCKVWDIIFDDYDFLDYYTSIGNAFILLGCDLEFLYNSKPDGTRRTFYLALVCGNREAYSREFWERFAKSAKKGALDRILRERDPSRSSLSTAPYKPETLRFKYVFQKDHLNRRPGSSVYVEINVENLFTPMNETTVVDCPTKLVSLKGNCLESAYLYWKYDNKFLQTIESYDIVGRGRYASVCGTKNLVTEVCGLKIQPPTGIPSKKDVWTQSFDLKCQRIFPWQVKFRTLGGGALLTERRALKDCLGWENRFCDEGEWKFDPVMESRVTESKEL